MGTKEWEMGRQRRLSGPKVVDVPRFDFDKTVKLLRAEIRAHMTETQNMVRDLQREHGIRLVGAREQRVKDINAEEDALMEALALRIKLMKSTVQDSFDRAESGAVAEVTRLSPRGDEKHIPRLMEVVGRRNEALDLTFELDRDQIKADLRAEIDLRLRTRRRRVEEVILDKLLY